MRANPSQVPDPGSRIRVAPEQPFLGQRREELDREERIAAGLFVHQLRQRPGGIPLAVQGIGDQPADIVEPEGRQHDLLHPRSGFADRVQRPRERVRRTDFVVAVSPNQHQVPYAPDRSSAAPAAQELPRPAIADRRGTTQADAPAWRTRRGIAGTPSGSGSAHLAAAGPERAAVSR